MCGSRKHKKTPDEQKSMQLNSNVKKILEKGLLGYMHGAGEFLIAGIIV